MVFPFHLLRRGYGQKVEQAVARVCEKLHIRSSDVLKDAQARNEELLFVRRDRHRTNLDRERREVSFEAGGDFGGDRMLLPPADKRALAFVPGFVRTRVTAVLGDWSIDDAAITLARFSHSPPRSYRRAEGC